MPGDSQLQFVESRKLGELKRFTNLLTQTLDVDNAYAEGFVSDFKIVNISVK